MKNVLFTENTKYKNARKGLSLSLKNMHYKYQYLVIPALSSVAHQCTMLSLELKSCVYVCAFLIAKARQWSLEDNL